MTDNGVGGSGADIESSGGHADRSPYNELDLSQTVQTEFSPSRAQDLTAQPSSIDTSVYNTLSNMPVASLSGSANASHGDVAAYDRQSLSRSMSRASSQSTDSIKITTMTNDINKDLANHAGELSDTKPTGNVSARSVENMPSLDAVSDSTLNVSTNVVSSDNVLIQNDMQDQSSPNAAQNGTTNTVPNLAAVIPDTGASSHGEDTAKPSKTLPAPTATAADPPSKSTPPTPTVPTPRARLPHDKIGILEDRIKEDPRGDIGAWLSLIDEHKKRAKLDDARGVYERFFSVFPSAVCLTILTIALGELTDHVF